ncbi:MAG: NADH-quinone oxidoreductase subunit H [Candidatus Gastranaerophilales bacterium]|nr:NADH-quinone oxidoreductase subunit H [Candidatus Gastranaerophilales bacterium]
MDFLINYYIVFLMQNHLTMTTGFFIWHAVTFLLMLIVLFVSVVIFNLIEKKLLVKFINTDSGINTETDQNNLPKSKFLTTISIASVIFMWLLLPVTTSLYPIKTDVGIFFFMAFLFVPMLNLLGSVELSDDKTAIKEKLHNIFFCLGGLLPVVLSATGVLLLTDSPAFRDIILIQNMHGFLSMFCFPCLIGVVVILVSLAAISSRFYPESSETPFMHFWKNAYFLTLCAYLVILFFGGYMPPLPFFAANFFEHSPLLYGLVLSIEQAFWLIIKTYLLYIGIIFIKSRFTSEIKTETFWKYLLPLAICNLFAVGFIAVKFGGFYVL